MTLHSTGITFLMLGALWFAYWTYVSCIAWGSIPSEDRRLSLKRYWRTLDRLDIGYLAMVFGAVLLGMRGIG